ncbi:hypothetical protein VV02_09090 [Luteipulveratus mongoliensis]|uniref:N-acetyltransferase domain-containing protein n=1 Tax=Luteipulveratus mongoliensis TaxID=571913 RepID=A0A0K1JGX6_9MICO|nr:hypothetical protein VV02_09090 [Luteipulveratus mongoliensis]
MRIIEVDGLSNEPAQQRLFAAWNEVYTSASRHLFGNEHSGFTVEEMVGRRRGSNHQFVDRAAVDGEPVGEIDPAAVVGMMSVAEPLKDNTDTGLLRLAVLPEHRRSGVGTELLRVGERVIAEHGRSVVQAITEWTEGNADESGEGFAAAYGYAPAQTTIRSAMPIRRGEHDLDHLRQLMAGDGVEDAAAFEIEASVDDLPEAWLGDLAVLEQRMSTDAPQGDTTLEEESWDAARVREELRWALDSGRQVITAVARDRLSDRLMGFTQIQVPPTDPTLAYQQDTLVLREARGNGLGLRLKACAALELIKTSDEVTRIRTWNADDNTHMLAVNADLGYEREGYLRVWEKQL